MATPGRRWLCVRSGMWALLVYCVCSHLRLVLAEDVESCEHLRLGQYLCKDPKISDATQEPESCRDMRAWVECLPAPNISCRLPNGTEFRFSGEEVGFNRTIACRNVSGSSYRVAVALSLFLGWLGADRFYLGYPALGEQPCSGPVLTRLGLVLTQRGRELMSCLNPPPPPPPRAAEVLHGGLLWDRHAGGLCSDRHAGESAVTTGTLLVTAYLIPGQLEVRAG
ncbi:TM2 domain-containing protein 1 isoform 1-T2 [Menidia menidia]